jgi:excisionase family DNA binding protein
MENKKTILLHNITPDELKDMIVADLKIEIEKLIVKTAKPKNYSVQEVSKMLGLSKLTIYNYIKKGTLAANKIGRKYIICSKSLEKALKDVKSLKYKRL